MPNHRQPTQEGPPPDLGAAESAIRERLGGSTQTLSMIAARAMAAVFHFRPTQLDEAYLGQATDIHDVELRIRELERRRAGFLF
jgi:hypothetical protein